MSIPSPSRENDEHRELINLTKHYSNYLWIRISNLPFFAKISKFCLQFGRARSRRQKLCLPLPLPSKSVDSSMILTEASRIYDVLDDIFEHLLLNMHNVQKNLQYWQDKAEGSNVQKAHFMVFERGPQALIGETVEFVRNFITKDSSFQILCRSASGFISERVAVLDSLRTALAAFLAQVYMVIHKQGEDLVADPQKSLPSLLVTINSLFSDLEISISQLHVSSSQVDHTGENNSSVLIFNKMTEAQREQSQWTDDQIRNVINIINQNLQKLDSYLSVLVARYQKPRKVTRHWIRYTCGAVGLSVCSLWIVRHSRLVGSPDIDNWIREAKDSTITFWTDHVEQPMLSIRNELFETFRKRHRGVMEAEEVQLTANSLHRMLVAFCEQTNGQKFPENVTDQELLELVMGRYEKEMTHPLKNTFSGELPRAMLIQVQKLKLDIETAMLELNQILRANEINFAILAALPAFAVVVLSLMLVRSRIMQDKGAEGRGRLARRQRRLLIVEIEKRVMHYQSCMDLGQLNAMLEYKRAKKWVEMNVTRYNFKGGVNIKYVAVGNEPFLKSYNGTFEKATLPALKNIQNALNEAGVGDYVKATVPLNADVYESPQGSTAPSAGRFRADVAGLMTEMVSFMSQNNAPFTVNIYPFLSLYGNPGFPVDYAFFDGSASPIVDNGIQYTNVFDANFDTLVSALNAAGYGNLPIIVGEVGWPTDGDIDANINNAVRFYRGLLPRIASNTGTPLRPGNIEMYLFGLLDEDAKTVAPGNFERHWGIFRYDGQPKFPMDLTGQNRDIYLVGAKDVKYLQNQWCEFNPNAKDLSKLTENMNFACTFADCTPLGYGSSCSGMDTNGNISYAFNIYFQTQNQNLEACNFQGLARLTMNNISTDTCNFIVQIASSALRTAVPVTFSLITAIVCLFF